MADVPGLAFQALHTADVAEAYRLALVRPVRGAFNLASEPVIIPGRAGRHLRRPDCPAARRRSGCGDPRGLSGSAGPTPPELVELFLILPLLDSGRAERELGWTPSDF
ncbi:MAG: hypothetical protein ABR540_16445 [Acidimicrobiales bacterium]